MALIASATYGSYPGMKYEFYAEQTGGSGNKRTVKLTLKLKCGGSSSSSWYGYAVNWRGYVNGTWSGWATVKGTESWNATQDFRTYSTTITTDVGTTSSKTIKVGFATDSQIDADWDFSKTDWNFTVGATNRAPSAPSNLIVRTAKGGASLSGTISENINSFYIDWTKATDADGDTIYYDLQEQRNGGSWTSIDGSGTDTAHSFNTTGGEGTSYRYWVDARDSKGAHSANGVYSATITKNVFTMDTLASGSTITYDTSQLSFTFSGGKNTQSGVSITRKLTCDNGITVHNATNITSSPITVKINKGQEGGTAGPYINWNDIKAKFATSSAKGKGTLNFTLTGTNSNGTTKTSTKAISINIQTNPNAVSNQHISTNPSESTNCLTITNGNKYFIPDGTKVMRVKWTAATGKLGEAVSYKIYVAYGSGGWNWLADLPTGTTYYNHAIAKQTVSQQVKYKIVSVSTYNTNLTAEAITPAQTLHYYNTPGLTQGTITRGSTSADVIFTVKTNSSIPNISTTGSWVCYNRGTTTNAVSSATSIGASQTAQTITVKNLTDEGTYDLYITYNDNTGLSSAQKTPAIQIGQNLPVFFVNKYGIGVNGKQATSTYSLNVKGSGYLDGLKIGTYTNLNCNTYKPDELWINRTAGTASNRPTDYATVFNIGCDGSSNFQLASSYSSAPGFWVRGRHDTSGTYHSWARVYTTLDKPTPADIGAAAASHSHNYIPTSGNPVVSADIETTGYMMCKDMRLGREKDKNGVLLSNKTTQSGKVLNISTGQGTVDIGPQNSTYCHYSTDRSTHYFNKEVQVDGDVALYANAANFVGRNDYGYQIRDNGGTPRYVLWMDKGNNGIVLGLSNERTIYTQGHLCPWTTTTYWLGTNSPNKKWKGVCCEGGTVGSSDAKLKENMVRLDGRKVLYNEETAEVKEEKIRDVNFDKASTFDYYEFMRDRFKPTYYNYKLSKTTNNGLTVEERIERDALEGKFYSTQTLSEDGETIEKEEFELADEVVIEDEMSMLKNVGFLAQDYDLETDKVAREFIFKTPTGELMYNHMSYATVGMIALQETIRELETVKAEKEELENRLKAIEEKLGL